MRCIEMQEAYNEINVAITNFYKVNFTKDFNKEIMNILFYFKFLVRLHGEYNNSLALWKHHVNFFIAELLIRKHGSSSVLIILALIKIRVYGSKTLQ